MKLIITEEQLKILVEYGIRDKVFNVPGESLEDKDFFYKMYKLYRDNKESKNYVGIRVIGDFNLMGVLGGNLSSELIYFCNNLVQVDGDLKVVNNYMVNFPKLRRVQGNMTLSMTEVESLPELIYVGGDLKIKVTPLGERTTEEELRNQINVDGDIIL